MADAKMLKKVPVREQDPKVRATNFEEVCLGYNQEEAMEEAQRCLGCKKPKCVEGCPVSINIPGFIEHIKEGNGVRKIKRYLEEHGIRTVTGKAEWSTSTIDRMLSNEKYMGILLLQKTYTPDFLTGKQKKNRGELSMYMIEDAHEAIIEKEVFEAVQKKKRWSTSCK